MLERVRTKLTYANVMATIAVFVALGGAAYAVTLAPKNSVNSRAIINGQVKSTDVKDNGLSGTDINESSLGKVPSAAQADSATNATNASNAANAAQLGGQGPSAYALAGAEAWQPASLNDGSNHVQCYWTNYGNGYDDAEYFRDRAGVVHLHGLVVAHDGTAQTCAVTQNEYLITTLPAGYQPPHTNVFSIISNNTPGRVNIRATGEVAIEPGFPAFSNAMTWVSLDGISFRCAPAGSSGCP